MRIPVGVRLLGRAMAMGLVCAVVSCGGGGGGTAPTQPSPPPITPPPPPSTAGAIRGSIVETMTGIPVPRASLTMTLSGSPVTVTADDGGAWEISHPGPLPIAIPVTVSAAGYVTRETQLRWATGTRDGVAVDLIRESAPFSIFFYRQLVRNLFETEDGQLEPLRRWVQNPDFYIDSRNPVTGGVLPQAEIDRVIALIREAVPQFTGGRFNAGAFEVAAEERAGRIGVINVSFFSEPEGDRCGFAWIGANPGRIELNYGSRGICGGRCGAFPWRTVVHEVGHAMGFWHVPDGFVLNTVWFDRDCDKTALSPAERHHAAVAYSRPRGNLDPDIDPASTLLLQAEGAPIRLSCR